MGQFEKFLCNSASYHVVSNPFGCVVYQMFGQMATAGLDLSKVQMSVWVCRQPDLAEFMVYYSCSRGDLRALIFDIGGTRLHTSGAAIIKCA